MLEEGFEHGASGVRAFTEVYGLLEKVTVIEPADNRCSEARVSKRVRRRPGASPLLFGRFLMGLGAFVSLEDISEALPPYQEEVVSVAMDPPLQQAYEELEKQIKEALKEHRGNPSVVSTALNALLLFPDRPFGLGDLYGSSTTRRPNSAKSSSSRRQRIWMRTSSTPRNGNWWRKLGVSSSAGAAARSLLCTVRRETFSGAWRAFWPRRAFAWRY